MALETGNFISDLVNTNPTGTDPRNQGDDHLRLIKSVLLSTFPNISGAMTLSHTQLNALVTDYLTKADNLGSVANAVTAFNNIKQEASETVSGVVEKATSVEALAGAANKFPDAADVLASILANAPDSNAPGAITAFAMNTPPTGWFECDGSAVSRTTYSELFTAIGTVFGVGDGTTTFNIPDVRGNFVRGWDNGAGVDTGRAFGSLQLDAFQGHEHQYDRAISKDGNTSGSYNQAVELNNQSTEAILTDGVNGTPRVASETRPRNLAFLVCIKY